MSNPKGTIEKADSARASGKAPRIAIGIDLEWEVKHHYATISGILRHANAVGWQCEFEPFFDPETAAEHSYDGYIARAPQSLETFAKKAGVPAVNVWRDSPAAGLPAVVTDSHGVGRMAASHLVERGLRRFGVLGFPRSDSTDAYVEGVRSVAEPSDYPVTQCLVTPVIDDAAKWRKLRERLIEWVHTWTKPIGIIAYSDIMARILTDICLQEGLRVPDDVALVGSGNHEITCELRKPTLTSINRNSETVGYEAARLLERLLNGEAPPTEPVLVPPAGVAVRQSTDVLAVEDRMVARALRFIWDHFKQPIGVADVARPIPLSSRTLQRRFQQAIGRSIHQEIIRSRIQHAKRLLVDTDDPIKAVAREAGFANGEHLARLFQRSEGVSPRAFRSERRGG